MNIKTLIIILFIISSKNVFSNEFIHNSFIALGNLHTCSINMGEVYCWGDNHYFQLGSIGNDSRIPKRIPNIAQASQIFSGSNHSCIILTTGAIHCWGGNSLGESSQNISNSTKQIFDISHSLDLKNVTMLALGDHHTCGLDKNGEIYCIGDNQYYQLSAPDVIKNSLEPVKINRLSKIKEIAAGANHNCALSADNLVFCWGDNKKGQLGSNFSPTKSKEIIKVSNLNNIKQISAKGDTSCALDDMGFVYCWGNNDFGQIGIESSNDSKVVHTPQKIKNLENISMIAVAENHVCALDSDGIVHCWGANFNKTFQLGQFTRETSNFIPREVPNLLSIKSISSGGHHTCAIATDSSIYCWGSNFQGQLGNGTVNESIGPTKVTISLNNAAQSKEYFLACYIYSDYNSSNRIDMLKQIEINSLETIYFGIQNQPSSTTDYIKLSGFEENGFFIETKYTYDEIIESCKNILRLKQKNNISDKSRKVYDFKAVSYNERKVKVLPIQFYFLKDQGEIKKIVVFGDSLSDNGNLLHTTKDSIPGFPYFKGRFSNGLIWNDYLSIQTKIPILNYAVGGAKTSSEFNELTLNVPQYKLSKIRNFMIKSMSNSINKYINSQVMYSQSKNMMHLASPDETLFVIWIGGNDYLDILNNKKLLMRTIDNNDLSTTEKVTNSITENILKLHDIGSKHILVVGLPDVGLTPEILSNNSYDFNIGKFKNLDQLSDIFSSLVLRHNKLLQEKLIDIVNNNNSLRIYYIDPNKFLLNIYNGQDIITENLFDYDIFELNSSTKNSLLLSNKRLQKSCIKWNLFGLHSLFNDLKESNLCVDYSNIYRVKTIFWDNVHPTSYTHCLLSFAIQNKLADYKLIQHSNFSLLEQKNYCESANFERK